MITACIDPGEHRSAVAIFDGTELVSLEWLEPGGLWPGFELVDRVVIEKPRLYPGHPRPANILNLAWGAALVAGAFRCNRVIMNPTARCDVKLAKGQRPLIVFEPSQWKGNVKKPPHHFRCWAKLSAHERGLFDRNVEGKIRAAIKKLARSKSGKVTGYSFEAHNLLDAMALGLFFVKRTEKGGAVVRLSSRRKLPRSYRRAA